MNPVIAVLLGWLFAGELLTPRILGATGLILAAVILLKADSAKRTADQRDEHLRSHGACGRRRVMAEWPARSFAHESRRASPA